MIDWSSEKNELRLNPRLPESAREHFEAAWRALVEPQLRGQIGIATSGSSGDLHGRLIVISKNAMLANARSVNQHFDIKASDVWINTLPGFHVGGLGIFARSHSVGSRVVLSDGWDAPNFVAVVEQEEVTLSALVPTQLFDLVRLQQRAPKSLRVMVIGGGRLESTLHQAALALGWPVYVSYGMTECGSQIATARTPQDPRLFAMNHAELRIGEGERIEIHSAALLTGQIRVEDQLARLEDPKQAGWFRAEDRGRIEADQTLTVLGREADFVKIGGEGVLMSRLEERLDALKTRFAFARDAAILAAADARLGAVVVMVTDADAAGIAPLVELFNREVLPFERIRAVHHVETIPRSALGKLLRRQALTLVGLEALANL